MDIKDYPEKTTGAYTFAEAARILLATHPPGDRNGGDGQTASGGKAGIYSRLRYWVNTNVVHDGLVKHSGPEKFIHFQALVSLRVISLLWARGISLQAIRKGEKGLREELGVPWPFISETFWRREAPLFPEFAAPIGASKHGPEAMCFLEEWLSENASGLKFNEYGLVYAWLPARNIVIDGRIISGRPSVSGRRIWPTVIRDCLEFGSGLEEIMGGYNLTEEQVGDALAWEKRIDAAIL